MIRFMLASLVFGVGLVLIGEVATAEVPDRSAEDMEGAASDVFIGKLRALYRSVRRAEQYEETSGLAEIVVDKVEKGDGVKPGQVVFARYWNRQWIGRGNPPPGSRGHRNPPEGTLVRAYVTRGDDGTFEAMLPNGLLEIKK
jgi:hypothetical protein